MGKVISINSLYLINITLDSSNPSIWRQLYLHKDTSLYSLHRLIQVIFSWSGSHEHTFEYTKLSVDKCSDELQICLKDLYDKEYKKFYYYYASGDGWTVKITIEKDAKVEFGKNYPYCKDGELSIPNEKCGSINGYYSIINALNNPSHPKYMYFIESFGTEDLEFYFNKEELNILLYACFRKI